MSTTDAPFLLGLFVETMVPLEIHDLAKIGGPTQEHLDYAKRQGWVLAEHGDELMFAPSAKKDKGRSAEMVKILTYVLAIMAFQPAGVTFLGLHFEATASKEVSA